MKRQSILRLCASALSALLLLPLCACGKNGESVSLSTTAPLENEAVAAAVRLESDAAAVCTYVILNDENTTINGAGAAFEDGVLTVSAPGTYQLRGTLSDGAIVVDTEEPAEVALLLDGVALHCDGDVPLSVRRAPGGTRLILAQNSVNEFSDGGDMRADDAAVISCEDALTIEGDGALTVTGTRDGITADSLTLTGGTLRVDAGEDSFSAQDAFSVTGGSLLACAGSGSACTVDGTCLNVSGSYPAGTVLRVLTDDGSELLQATVAQDCARILIADTRLVSGALYGIAADNALTAMVKAN